MFVGSRYAEARTVATAVTAALLAGGIIAPPSLGQSRLALLIGVTDHPFCQVYRLPL